MNRIPSYGAALVLALACSSVGAAEFSNYTIDELMKTCMEGDSSARWGEQAESECEQYIMGFTDGYVMYAREEPKKVCLPADNRPDEIRWAFTEWANNHYDQRKQPAAEGLEATLRTRFACP